MVEYGKLANSMANKIRVIFRFLSLLLSIPALIFGTLHWLHVRSPQQVVLRTAKSTAQALAALLALSGIMGAALGWLARSPAAVLAGLAGSLLSTWYGLRVLSAAQRLPKIILFQFHVHWGVLVVKLITPSFVLRL
jgi:hypothetical protein